MLPNRRYIIYSIGVCSLALVVGACGASSASSSGAPGVSKTSITLGTTSPLTGPIASSCKPLTDGAQAWFNHINEQGGVNGRKVNEKVLDDSYQAPQAVANTRQFIQQGVFAVFGGCGSIQPAAIGPILNQAGVPYLFPYAGLKSLIEPVQKSTFAILPLFGAQGASLVKYAFKKNGPGSVLSVFSSIPDVKEQIGVEKAATEKAGGKWLGSEITTAGTTDYTPTALRIKAKNPDYVIMSVPAADALRILRAFSTQGFTPGKRVLGTSTLASASFLKPASDLLSGKVLVSSPTAPQSDPAAKNCLEAFGSASPKVAPGAFSLFGCATAQLFVSAIKKAGPKLTRERLVSAINSWNGTKASPLFPPVTFSNSNHLGATQVVVLGYSGGKITNEGAADIAPSGSS